jgi:hypothetical protein
VNQGFNVFVAKQPSGSSMSRNREGQRIIAPDCARGDIECRQNGLDGRQ